METRELLFFITLVVVAVGYIPIKLIIQIFYRKSSCSDDDKE